MDRTLMRDHRFESALVSGGDARLRLDPSCGANVYGAFAYPRPEIISFASSTASTLSEAGYESARALFVEVSRCRNAGERVRTVETRTQEQRRRLASLLGLSDGEAEIILSPSGTDSQLHAWFVGRAVLGKETMSLIAAADETGSGAKHATAGRHFSSITAGGARVAEGVGLSGWGEGSRTVAIALREQSGRMRLGDELDEAVMEAIAAPVRSGKPVLLYAMRHSKTGLDCPSDACLRAIRAKWSDAVQIVIDACQFRLGRDRIRSHLAHGDMVLITGSKFFGGPPFSGALLVPATLYEKMRALAGVPEGFTDYTTRFDWPASWKGVRAALEAQPNVGQLLRWAASLTEMQRYFAIPADTRRFVLAHFTGSVLSIIDQYPAFTPLYERRQDGRTQPHSSAEPNTIFPFLIYRDGTPLTLPETKALYRALVNDVTSVPGSSRRSNASGLRCHIGQPVAIPMGNGAAVGALRVSCGARNVTDLCRDNANESGVRLIERLTGELSGVFESLQQLLDRSAAVASKLPAS